ncbi:MAG TPA: DUF5996 family protein [Thermoanaerobaculia bacterium]
MPSDAWPSLHLEEWRPSYETLHLWMQIVGKIRLALTPLQNHWWNTTLYLTPRGLTTSAMPYQGGAVELRFDFIDHKLVIETSWRLVPAIDLRPQSSADLYATLMSALSESGIDVTIWPVTVEMPAAIRLDSDRDHSSYDREAVHRWWRIMLSVDTVLKEFRANFIGKSSPVHFFWGSFDLAASRFNGRRASQRREGPLAAMMNEAYSHEVISAGFWPGSGTISDTAFYAYAAPQPDGFAQAKITPAAAYYDTNFGEFILMYEDVRRSGKQREVLLDFLQSTYEAGANLGHWDRAALERS